MRNKPPGINIIVEELGAICGFSSNDATESVVISLSLRHRRMKETADGIGLREKPTSKFCKA
jgi:hypothetical protein